MKDKEGRGGEGAKGTLQQEVQRATLVALRRLAGGNGYDGTQNIDGLHFEMTDAFLESNSGNSISGKMSKMSSTHIAMVPTFSLTGVRR